ncbi:MAG TPA: type II toxin-antitoxin system HipA family toxin YjjJ [Steroidobacteraceae bacterium]|nr:type II toxin-antitoxin system HipA family toxin YjjJ [Steroidobacteraceae bacterium]
MAAVRDDILERLQSGTASSPELEQRLGLSQSAVNRQLRLLLKEGRLVRIGSRRGARYALLNAIEGIGSRWPLRRIDEHGRIHELGQLSALTAGEWLFETSEESFAWTGLSHGLPYFLQDQRPGGFLGRAVPQRYPELNLPQRVSDWSDTHYLRYLTQRGSDTVGDLILGDAALDEYLASLRHRSPVPADRRADLFPQLADQVMAGGLPGSSAHGEHPKFAVLLEDDANARHVIVKFSPIVDTPIGQRWSDLLVTEHLAHQVLTDAGVAAATSQIHQFQGRTYLEVNRFDRAGVDGRVGVTSLLAIDTQLYGAIDNWIAASTRLHLDDRISTEDLEATRLAATFGSLIANTDRHFGNLAFYDRYDGRFALAPIYDMLPMLFAPEHSQIVKRAFTPPDPTSETIRVYGRARVLAEQYWQLCANDARISQEFRNVCSTCGETLQALPSTGAYAYCDVR